MLVPSQTNQTGTAWTRPSVRVVLIQMEYCALSGKSTLFQGIKPDKDLLLFRGGVCLPYLIAFLGYRASYSGVASISCTWIVLPLWGLTETTATGVSNNA